MSGIHIAGNSGESFTPYQLFAGESEIVTNSYNAVNGLTLDANSVVAFDPSGDLVEWVPGAGDSTGVAVGVNCEAIDNSAGAANQPIYVAGYFNTDALNWPTSTDAQKKAAFVGTRITHRSLGYSG